MSLSIKVKEIYPLDNMLLRVVFVNGVTKIYDVKLLLNKFDIFTPLKDTVLFNCVYVDCGGYSIAWNNDIDISEVELWENGILLK